MKEIKSLTGVRGIAAVYVVIYHIINPSESYFINNGYLGVDIFFVLSGYVLSYTHLQDFSSYFSIKKYFNFITSRFIRVWPLYFFWLIAMMILYMIMDVKFTFIETLSNLLLIQNWGLTKPILVVSWSLSIEIILYLILPFALYTLCNKFKLSLILFLSSISAIILLAYSDSEFFWGGQPERRGGLDYAYYHGFGTILRAFSDFYLGIFAFKIVHGKFSRIKKIKYHMVFDFVIFLWILFILSKNQPALIALTWPLLVGYITIENTLFYKILGGKVVRHLGVISYSIYLSHPFLVIFLDHYFHFGIINSQVRIKPYQAVLILSLVYLLALFSYYTIEKNIKAIIKKSPLSSN
ncbi:acyltransferase [Serratia symbiotica]|uniref:acyltransferase family protein n=1 Tax=Serratia symbiotica TaxID=138074 RepID=UPI001887CB60|nr:acyltransferase [Serratia symbiotica]MBF1994836.1 acyltransferase [Serratia symbiotica]